MIKNKFKGTFWFYKPNIEELETVEDWAEYLRALLFGPCAIQEIGGRLTLIETRVRIDSFAGLKIEIYHKEHSPPHFHVKSSKGDASFTIEDASLLHGSIRDEDHRKIRYWHQSAKPMLITKWNETRPTNCVVGPYRGL